MTNTEMNNLKGALEAKRVELMYDLSGRIRELMIEAGQPDPIDSMQSMNDRDAAANIMNRFSSTLADVDRALRAVADGEYGICTECERPNRPETAANHSLGELLRALPGTVGVRRRTEDKRGLR